MSLHFQVDAVKCTLHDMTVKITIELSLLRPLENARSISHI
jgi:hypothetical protein